MKIKTKTFKLIAITLMTLIVLTACGNKNSETTSENITIVSREEGSGTRGAFIELFKVEEKNKEGKKVDNTTDQAIITNSTAIMLTTVAGDKNAIGYVSLGALNDTVKTLDIDGVKASVEEIKLGKYEIARPFNIVTKETVSPQAQDFINFILSVDGQAVVEKAGYIAIDTKEVYTSSVKKGKVTVSGSSSVSPVMEKLKEAYMKLNPNVAVEVQQNDSSTGVQNVIDGTSDIGMASRNLKDSEKQKQVHATVIAIDGIAVIVNPENQLQSLTKDQVKDIFTGNVDSWSSVLGNK